MWIYVLIKTYIKKGKNVMINDQLIKKIVGMKCKK